MKKCLMIATAVAGSALFAGDTITAATTFGAMCVDSATSNTVISVPWAGADDGTAIKLANLISTSNLSTGDKLYLYESETWYSYELNSTGSWEGKTTTSRPAGTAATTVESEKLLPRGTAMILQRTDKTKPIILMGKYDTTAVTAVASPVSVPAGKSVLIGNPTTETKYISVGSNGDVIEEIKDGGASKLYVYDTDHWTEEMTVQRFINGEWRDGKTYETLSTGVPIAPGCGVRYISSSKAASVTLN